ncbi:MAG: hypothetical protein IPJ79_07920 [Bacteroidetes bacterium]|nr:hypothetical protein [Bacteroidota bacterium]
MNKILFNPYHLTFYYHLSTFHSSFTITFAHLKASKSINEKTKGFNAWVEFPPVINGGLGVACHDLCIAMSKHAKVTMIIPKSNPDFKVNDLNLIGLDTIDSRTLKHVNYKDDYKTFEDVHFIPSDLNPYYTERKSDFKIPGVDIRSQYMKEIEVGSRKAKFSYRRFVWW